MRWKRNRKSGSNELRFLVLRKYKVHTRSMDYVTFVTCLTCVTCATLLLPPGYMRSTSPGSKRSHIEPYGERVPHSSRPQIGARAKKIQSRRRKGLLSQQRKEPSLAKTPPATSIVFFLSLQFWVCPDAENFPYTMPYGKTCYAS